MNQVSHYLDGSAVYGSTEKEAKLLRTFNNGLLKVQSNSLLPDDSTTSTFDFLAGKITLFVTSLFILIKKLKEPLMYYKNYKKILKYTYYTLMMK